MGQSPRAEDRQSGRFGGNSGCQGPPHLSLGCEASSCYPCLGPYVHGNGERSLTTDYPSVAVTCDKDDEVRRITPRDYRVPRQARGGGARLTFTAIANSRMRERHKKGDL